MARNESCSDPDHEPTTLTEPPSCSNWKPLPLAPGDPLSDGEPLSAGDPLSVAALLSGDAPVPADAAGDPPLLLPPHAATTRVRTAPTASARTPGRSRCSMRSSCA